MRFSPFIVACLFLTGGISTVVAANQHQSFQKSFSLSFQKPSLIDDDAFVQVMMPGAAACMYCSGKPVLPLYTTTLQLPFGSSIQTVTIDYGMTNTLVLQKKIIPAPYPLVEGTQIASSTLHWDEEVYKSDDFYPDQWITYTTGGGLNEKSEHVTFLTIQVSPVRYSPRLDTIMYMEQCNITVTYDPPMYSPFPDKSTFDLVIITPSLFTIPLQRLAAHKNAFGVNTQITTLEEISKKYPGNDNSEQIKYFIKYAIETWGVTYVLLVGGMKSHFTGTPRDNLNVGTRDWYLPVRYTNLWDIVASPPDPGFISDLYYADIYDGKGAFCSWDSCGDGVYGGWSNPSYLGPPTYQTDQIDFFPDVYLGRLPCRNIFEVDIVVDKIISYEKKPANISWFKRMVMVGGDPYDDQGTNYVEGELIGEKALMSLHDFQGVRLYASYRNGIPSYTPVAKNIIREISNGCGFLFLDGHGSPVWWNTYWPGEFDAFIKRGGLTVYQFPWLRNADRLPVCIIGGCHSSLFNVTLLGTITDSSNEHATWSYGLPTLECWSWALTAKRNGGAIATIGSTGLGYEAGGEVGDLNGDNVNDPDCIEALGGYLEIEFFKAYGSGQTDVLGNAWCAAINAYLSIYPGMQNRSDAKTVEQWVVLGDPSLKIGGYRS